MNNLTKYVKPVFHILTLAATALALANNPVVTHFVPEQYLQYISVASAAISGGLHFLTRFFPDVAAAEGK